MAIDRNKTKALLEGINFLFDEVTGKLSSSQKDWIKEAILGPAIKEIEKIAKDSRPPIFYLIGRSGHGKSSLINALANKQIAETGDIKPKTFEPCSYTITFEETYSTWQIIDSRGIFETTTPSDSLDINAVEQLYQDLIHYKPDVILHTISAPESRNLKNDLKLFKEISEKFKNDNGFLPPTIVILNKSDTLGNPREWPPEKSAKKAGLIHDLLNYFSNDILRVESENIDLNSPIKGYIVSDAQYVGLIPVCSLFDEQWNIDTLSAFIGNYLPESAILDFFQAQKRKGLIKNISSSLIKRFATIAGTIGFSPIPFSDIIILIPLQLLMIAFIGGLSCRSFSKETAYEFLTASGINIGTAFGLKVVAQQLSKLFPIAGDVVSGAIASSATFGLGKAAESYFFYNKIVKPDQFKYDSE